MLFGIYDRGLYVIFALAARGVNGSLNPESLTSQSLDCLLSAIVSRVFPVTPVTLSFALHSHPRLDPHHLPPGDDRSPTRRFATAQTLPSVGVAI